MGLLLMGCPKNTDSLNPNDTLADGAPATGTREDWINPTQMTASQGLQPRDIAFLESHSVRGIQSSIYFEFDNYSLQPSQRITLSQAADFLKQKPSTMVVLEGHCDWFGTTEYNLSLGDKRARTVKACLVEAGIAANRMEILSKGSLEATANLSKEEALKDRRVDIILLQ